MGRVPKSLEDALAACIDRIESGAATAEEALRDYPQFRAELEPLVSLAADLQALPKVMAPGSLREAKRPVFAPHTRAIREPDRVRRQWWAFPGLLPSFRWASPVAATAAGLALAILISGGTLVASASSLPDEPLYPVKLAVENVQLALAQTPEAKADIALQIAGKRLDEVEEAARRGKSEVVERGLALYEDSVGNALKLEADTSRPGDAAAARLDDALDRQQETLERVYNQVPQQAQPAITHAMDVSKQGRGRLEKGQQPGSAPQPQPTAGATPTPDGGGVAPATPTQSPQPDKGGPEPRDGTRAPGKGSPPDKANPSEKSRSDRSDPSDTVGPPGASGASDGGSTPGKSEGPTTVPAAWPISGRSGSGSPGQESAPQADGVDRSKSAAGTERGVSPGDGPGSRERSTGNTDRAPNLGELMRAWWPPFKWSPESLASPTSSASDDTPSATPSATAFLWPRPPSTATVPASTRPISTPVPSTVRGTDGNPTSVSDGPPGQERNSSSVGDRRSQGRQQGGPGRDTHQQPRDD